ncbi:NUDIX domain-containing protein [Candidatus Falkowbacteria bacterium]|nr:NUDIX domain-containing protein [Candidatus Falkowbacteria bacterium]
MNGRFLVATGAIIENAATGKILLLKRSDEKDFSPGIWEYVTGRLHQFEEPEVGLRREVMEETGADIEIIKPISIFHIFRGERIAENELVGIMYWCKTNTDDIRISEEHSDWRWVTPEEAREMVTKQSMLEDIEAFINERGK